MKSSHPVLIVDDEVDILNSFDLTLRAFGLGSVICCAQPQKALEILDNQPLGCIVLDLSMPDISGYEILSHVVSCHPEVPVIVVTGVESIESAVDCMKRGAVDYLAKPVEEERLIASVRTALEMSRLRRENTSLKQCLTDDRLENPDAFKSITTASHKMRQIFQYLEAVANSSEPILIMGETGVGKELIARAAHQLVDPKKPFVAINVAGLDDMVFSDTLFGHRKGAFTGAINVRKGLVDQAGDGILFLDEIGDMGQASQVKLLRLLQEHEYLPLGSDIPKPSNARIVVATNRDLDMLVTRGEFRKDLYYRLCTHPIRIPPLRERPEDIPGLLKLFMREAADNWGKPVPTIGRTLLANLCAYSFPGNIRELRALVFDAMGRWNSGEFYCLPGENILTETSTEDFDTIQFPTRLPTIEETVQALVNEALVRASGKQTAPARMLGISQPALSKLLKKSQQGIN